MALPSMNKHLVISDFPCPECGYDHLTYAEDTTNYHTVRGITFDGTILVSDHYNRGDPYGDNARFFCPSCGAHFDALDFKYRFVDNNEFELAEDLL